MIEQSMEELDEATPFSMTRDANTLVLTFRPWWSHRPDEALQALRRARYLQISRFDVGLGAEGGVEAERSARGDLVDQLGHCAALVVAGRAFGQHQWLASRRSGGDSLLPSALSL